MEVLKNKAGLALPDYRNPARGYHFEDVVLEALDAIHRARVPYERGKDARFFSAKKGACKITPFTVVGFASTPAIHKDLVRISRVLWSGDAGTGNQRLAMTAHDAETIAMLLFRENSKSNLYLVPHGEYKYLQMLAESHGLAWSDMGYDVEPMSRKGVYSGLTIRMGKSSWRFMDFKRHLGLAPEDFPEYVDCLAGGTSRHEDALHILHSLVKDFHARDRKYFRISSEVTAAQTGMELHKRFFAQGQKMWRPCPTLVSYSRFAGGMSGGYQYYSSYRGKGFEVDQRKAYSKSMSQPIPQSWATGSAYTEGAVCDGMYLSWVTKSGGLPVRIGVYDPHSRRFVPQLWSGGQCLAVICTVEHPGLEAMGCSIQPIYGWRVLTWFTMKDMIESVWNVLGEVGHDAKYGKRIKYMINAIPGKLAVTPEREETCISREWPGEDWLQATTADGEEIENNWVRTDVRHASYHNVASSAWIYASQRSDAYEFIAEMLRQGKECVHFAVDGGLFKGEAPTDIPTDTNEIGAFRLLHKEADITVSNHNQTIVNGVRKAAGVRQDINPRLILLQEDIEIISVVNKQIRAAIPSSVLTWMRKDAQTDPYGVSLHRLTE